MDRHVSHFPGGKYYQQVCPRYTAKKRAAANMFVVSDRRSSEDILLRCQVDTDLELANAC